MQTAASYSFSTKYTVDNEAVTNKFIKYCLALKQLTEHLHDLVFAFGRRALHHNIAA